MLQDREGSVYEVSRCAEDACMGWCERANEGNGGQSKDGEPVGIGALRAGRALA